MESTKHVNSIETPIDVIIKIEDDDDCIKLPIRARQADEGDMTDCISENFDVSDLVFAKMREYRTWPAEVIERNGVFNSNRQWTRLMPHRILNLKNTLC